MSGDDDATSVTRRRFLTTTTGAVVGLATVGVGSAAGSAGTDTGDWVLEETPTQATLHDVAYTSEGTYAVGSGGVVLARTADGRWETVLDGGPTGNGNNLYGCDVAGDGSRLWFVGASGAIGEYDPTAGVLTDHSAPNDVTNNFNDVSAIGPVGESNVYVAGDSGKIYASLEDGATGSWGQVTPGSGSAIHALDFFDGRAGHAVDGNQTVFATDDGGTYETVGIQDADVNFYGVDADGPEAVTVCGAGGSIYVREDGAWVRTDLGDARLQDVERCDCGRHGYTVAGGGTVFRKDAEGWTRESTPTGQNLTAVVRGETPLAVGAGGTVLAKK